MALFMYHVISPKYENRPGRFSWFYPLDEIKTGKDGKKPYPDKIDRIFEFPLSALGDMAFPKTLIPAYAGMPPPGRLPAWDPFCYSCKDYLLRVEENAKEALKNDPCLSVVNTGGQNDYVKLVVEKAKQYCDRVKSHVKNKHLVLHEVKTKPMLKTHLEWAAKVSVLEKSYTQVTRERSHGRVKRPARTAVRKATMQVLSLIEPPWAARLPERFPRGRPRQS